MEAREGLEKLAGYPFVVLSWVGEDGYPINVAVEAEIRPQEGTARFAAPAGVKVPKGTQIGLTGSHIKPQPGGYGERRHVTASGQVGAEAGGRLVLRVSRAWGWDEREVPFPEYTERAVGQSRRYFASLSAMRGARVGPRLPLGLLAMRTTRAPFLSATLVPVLLGIAVAARGGVFDLASALITIVAASAVHLGLNVTNDIFDTLQGADDANVTPTKFSGGSRVLQYGLVRMRSMVLVAVACYAVAFALGLVLLAMRGSTALIVIAAVGFFISLAYTVPPFKLVYRGLGEIATGIGFGPVMLLGAYTVQTRGSLSWEALVASIPVALLVALILYVNEIPDRAGDQKAGKRTLPVRWSKTWVIRAWDLAAAATFLSIVAGAAAGVLPLTTLAALLAVPLAVRVHRGLVTFYDNPYALMATMGANIGLHMRVGALLVAGYLAAIAAQSWLGVRLLLW
jgi:1,4-dihydroxy-2-naphthoate octaprenyltransferase